MLNPKMVYEVMQYVHVLINEPMTETWTEATGGIKIKIACILVSCSYVMGCLWPALSRPWDKIPIQVWKCKFLVSWHLHLLHVPYWLNMDRPSGRPWNNQRIPLWVAKSFLSQISHWALNAIVPFLVRAWPAICQVMGSSPSPPQVTVTFFSLFLSL